jgi:hypothetical protein
MRPDILLLSVAAVSWSGCGGDPSLKEASAYAPSPDSVWSVGVDHSVALAVGDWDGTEGDEVLVLHDDATVTVFDLTGAEVDRVELDASAGYFHELLLGQTSDGIRLSVFGVWDDQVETFAADGTHLFAVEGDQGVDSARWGDHDGDGSDDLLIGYNGPSGIARYSHTGVLTGAVGTGPGWGDAPDYSPELLGNVWSLDIAPADGEQPGVVAAIDGTHPVLIDRSMAPVERVQLSTDVTVVEAFRTDGGAVQVVTVEGARVVAFDASVGDEPVWSVPGLEWGYGYLLGARPGWWLTSGVVGGEAVLAHLQPEGFSVVDSGGGERARFSLGGSVWNEFAEWGPHSFGGMGFVTSGDIDGLVVLRDGWVELFPL